MHGPRRSTAFLALVGLLAIPVLSGCTSVATPSAMCGYIVGNGEDGHDAKIHKVVWPDQNVSYDSATETARYVPCNPRNFIINDGKQVNANGDKVGDRSTGSVGRTADGTEVFIYSRSEWTLNQSEASLLDFATHCFKYDCYSTEVAAGTANFATPGWNGWLGEYFAATVDDVARAGISTLSDDIWKKDDPVLREQLSEAMSNQFRESFRSLVGFNNDIICGSGSSGWKDPAAPGQGEFTCSNVRIKVTSIVPVNAEVKKSNEDLNKAEQEKTVNAEELAAAKAKYGDNAEYWLGLQDTIEKCNAAVNPATCIISIGGEAPVVAVPQQQKTTE